MESKNFCNIHCPVEATLNLIGGKYKVLILYNLLLKGTLRFNELNRLISKVTPKVLTNQLKELEKDGLISKTIYPVIPPKTEYKLTALGQNLIPIMNAMRDWGKENIYNNK